MHSVDKKFRTNPKEIILTILEVIHNLVEPCCWIAKRRNYLENQPNSIAFWSTDHVEGTLAREIIFVADLIDKAKFKKFFGIDLRKRRYHCPDCNSQCADFSSVEPKLAQLEPNHPTSTNLHCYLCGVDREVVIKSCNKVNSSSKCTT